jgi:phasin family protein
MVDERAPAAPRATTTVKPKAARAPRKPVAASAVPAAVKAPEPVVAAPSVAPTPPVATPIAAAPVVKPTPAIPLPAAPVAAAPVIEPAPVAAPAATDTLPAEAPARKEPIMNETLTANAENLTQKAQDGARTMFTQASEQTRSAMEKTKKAAEEMAEFGKGNLEALVESSRIAAQGFEAMGKDAAAFFRSRYDSTAEVVKSMAAVKSPTELMQLQADFFRGAFDAMVAEASRTTEVSMKLAGDIAKPIQNRVALAADKVKVAA